MVIRGGAYYFGAASCRSTNREPVPLDNTATWRRDPCLRIATEGEQLMPTSNARKSRLCASRACSCSLIVPGAAVAGMQSQGMQVAGDAGRRGCSRRGCRSQGMQSQGSGTGHAVQGMQLQGMQSQGMQSQGIQSQGMQVQGIQVAGRFCAGKRSPSRRFQGRRDQVRGDRGTHGDQRDRVTRAHEHSGHERRARQLHLGRGRDPPSATTPSLTCCDVQAAIRRRTSISSSRASRRIRSQPVASLRGAGQSGRALRRLLLP